MRILALADLHNVYYNEWQKFLKINKCSFDIMVLLGDIDIMFYKSISENFSDKQIVGVLGNHDYIGDLENYNLNNIHGKFIKIEENTFSGIEGSVRYKRTDSPIYSQEEIVELCKTLPKSDIIISHNSPLGIHDRNDMSHHGYQGLMDYINKNSPKYCLHGHQHINKISKYNETYIIGVYGGVILDTKNGEISAIMHID